MRARRMHVQQAQAVTRAFCGDCRAVQRVSPNRWFEPAPIGGFQTDPLLEPLSPSTVSWWMFRKSSTDELIDLVRAVADLSIVSPCLS